MRKKLTRVVLPESLKKFVKKKYMDSRSNTSKLTLAKLAGYIQNTLSKFVDENNNKVLFPRITPDRFSRAFGGREKGDNGCTIETALALFAFVHGSPISYTAFTEQYKLYFEKSVDILQVGDGYRDFNHHLAVIEGREKKPTTTSSKSLSPTYDTLLRNLSLMTSEAAALIENVTWGKSRGAIHLHEVYITRSIESEILEAIDSKEQNKLLVVSGEAGYGKTSLLCQMHHTLSKRNECVSYFLKSSQLVRIDFEKIISLLIKERKRIVFFIDTIDILLHTENDTEILISSLKTIYDVNACVVVSTRPQELSTLSQFRNILPFKVFTLGNFDNPSDLESAIHKYALVYHESEPLDTREQIVNDVLNIAANNYSLQELCSSPLTLRMLFSVYAPQKIPHEINIFQLYRDFWRDKVAGDSRSKANPEIWRRDRKADLTDAASKLAIILLSKGVPEILFAEIETHLNECNVQYDDLKSLMNRGVLKGDFKDSPICFFHQTFFEHVAAQGIAKYNARIGEKLLTGIVSQSLEQNNYSSHLFFLLPIYEQFLLLAASSSIKEMAETALVELIRHDNVILRQSGLYVYALFETTSPDCEVLIKNIMRDYPTSQSQLIKRFLRIAPSASVSRIDRIIEKIQIIWSRGIWNEQQNVILTLEHLFHHDKFGIAIFFKENKIIETAIANHSNQEQGRHSKFFSVIIRMLIKIHQVYPVYAYGQLEKLTSQLEIVDLCYLLELIQLNSNIDLNSLLDIVMNAAAIRSKSIDNDRQEIDREYARGLALYWKEKWKTKKVTKELLWEIGQEKSAFIAQTKATALLSMINMQNEVEASLVYSYYKKHLITNKKVQWSKWVFTPLLDSPFKQLPPLLEHFLDDLNKDITKDLATSKTKTGAEKHELVCYFEAFFKCKSPFANIFHEISSDFLFETENWNRIPKLVDIFVSAAISGYPAVNIFWENAREKSNLQLEEAVVVRLYTNIIDRKYYTADILSFVTRHLLSRDMATVINSLVVRCFSKKTNDKEAILIKKSFLLHQDSLLLFINRGINARNSRKEYYGQLWFTCIQNELLPKPSLNEVVNAFKMKRGEKYKVPVLLNLIHVCKINNQVELETALNIIEQAIENARFSQFAQVVFLDMLAQCELDISYLQDKIFKLVLRDWGSQHNDDKIKALNKVIINHFNRSPKFSSQLLLDIITAPHLIGEIPRKRNEIFHDLWKACQAYVSNADKEYIDKFIQLLLTADLNSARPIIAALFRNTTTRKEYWSVWERYIMVKEMNSDVKMLLQEYMRNKVIQRRTGTWEEILTIIR